VDAIVIGSITQFGRDDKNQGVNGGALSNVTGRFGVGGFKHRESKAVVGISARMVDTETAEILAAARGVGESKRTGTSLACAGGGDVDGPGGVRLGSSNFGQTIIGEATNDAVMKLCAQLEQTAVKLPVKTVSIHGLVADASGGSRVLNIGSRAGVKVGDRFQVRRKIREVKDPASGKVLRSIEDKVGEVVITEVDEGSGTAQTGDAVTNL
jgi:hypothetical protein